MYFTVPVYLLLLCLILLTCQTHEAVHWSGCCVQYYCEWTQGDLWPGRQLAQVPPGNQSLCSVLPGWPCYPTTPSGDAEDDGRQRRWWTDWWRLCVSMSSVWFNPWLKRGGSLTDYTQDEKALKGDCDCTQGRLYLFGRLFAVRLCLCRVQRVLCLALLAQKRKGLQLFC